MKKIFTFIVVFCSSFLGYSQFNLNIDFESNGQYAVIDNSQPDNIWQKGTPSKTFFNSAYSVPFAIVTDTLLMYPDNNLSTFRIRAITPGACWGIGYLTFWHKYKTDSLHAGGYVEVAYDSSTVFHNIIFDTVEPQLGHYGINFYTKNDTITGGIPAFSGNSAGWIFSQYNWIWMIGTKSPFHDSLTIHFNFKSDGPAVPDEGWMIDNIQLVINACTGAIEDHEKNIPKVEITPDPFNDKAAFRLIHMHEGKYKLSIFDRLGSNVLENVITPSRSVIITRSGLSSGLYFYQVTDGKTQIVTGKFMIK